MMVHILFQLKSESILRFKLRQWAEINSTRQMHTPRHYCRPRREAASQQTRTSSLCSFVLT